MSNRISISVNPTPPAPTVREVPVSGLFRYVLRAGNENVYMRTPSGAVLLNTGNYYPDSDLRLSSPVEILQPGTVVRLEAA